jgi:hypothetical protein
MKILFLTIFFIGLIWWKINPEEGHKSSIDVLKIRQGAPQREIKRQVIKEFHQPELNSEIQKASNNIQDSHSKNKKKSFESIDDSVDLEDQYLEETSRELAGEISDEVIESESVEKTEDFEGDFNSEISELLLELDPVFGEEIFLSYNKEREIFQAQIQEIAQNDDGSAELESVIHDLENQHEERLKEILGPYYQTVKEHHTKFLENTPR